MHEAVLFGTAISPPPSYERRNDMASVLPLRPNTNSGSTSGSSRGAANLRTTQPIHDRQPSLRSFPSSKTPLSQNGSTNHQYSRSNTSNAFNSHAALTKARQRPVRSQYPHDTEEKHVEYILVASFDIDRGSVMEHQYPGPVGGDEHMLAELMLPDQAHVRSQDWTIFFLHKDGAAEEEEGEGRRRKKRRKQEEDGYANGGAEDYDEDMSEEESEEESDDDDDSLDGPPLVYVLNLVNTKQDNTVKRGAVVKAMAVCTRHSFLHIYKPLLLLALQQYFAKPDIETLASLYDAVNSMDLSLLPRLSHLEKSILQNSDAKDLFLEKFEAIIAQRMAAKEDKSNSTLSPPSPTAQLPGAATRGGRYGLPRDTHEFESVVKYANVPVPVKIPVALSPETVGDFSLIKLITTFSTPHSASPTPFNPTHPHLTTNGPMTHPIVVLINALLTQKRIIFLGHNLPSSSVAEAVLGACALASGGLLRGFTRHAFPYTDLTKIDDLLKVPGFIAGVTNPAFAHKAEWWDLLCDLGTGKMKISNRMEQAPLTEGVVYFQQNGSIPHSGPGSGISAIVGAGASLSAGLGGNTVPTGSLSGDVTGDGVFMAGVLAAIQDRRGEMAIRAKFRTWVLKFTRLAAAFEEVVYGATPLHIHHMPSPKIPVESPHVESPRSFGRSGQIPQQPSSSGFELPLEVAGHGYVWPTSQSKINELAANATRIEGWRNTRSYYNFIQDLAALYVHRPVKDIDLHHLYDKLAKLRLGHEQSSNIYLALCAAVRDEREVNQLLAVICAGDIAVGPQQQGSSQGLLVLALGLFHPKMEVREQVAELLLRVREHEAGHHFWRSLGRFVKKAWERIMAGRVARLGGGEEE